MQRPASSVLLAAAALGASAWTAPAAADTILEVDLLSVSQARNTVQISNTGDGTRFSLVDVLGRSSQTTARLTLVTRGFRPG
jgi:hypothetical protein